MEELAALADTAGLQVEGGTYQRLAEINPNTLIGTGKLEELQGYRDELNIDVFLFDDELSPRQQRLQGSPHAGPQAAVSGPLFAHALTVARAPRRGSCGLSGPP